MAVHSYYLLLMNASRSNRSTHEPGIHASSYIDSYVIHLMTSFSQLCLQYQAAPIPLWLYLQQLQAFDLHA